MTDIAGRKFYNVEQPTPVLGVGTGVGVVNPGKESITEKSIISQGTNVETNSISEKSTVVQS